MTFESFGKRSEARKALLEGLIVMGVGLLLALLANAISPRGLKLDRDYYHLNGGRQTAQESPVKPAGASTLSTEEQLEAKLRALGLRLVDSNQVAQLFNDPARLEDLVVFIDARDPEHYKQGHIPWAYEFDNYHPEQAGVVWPVCQTAKQIVVYCVGGECDESRYAAQTLAELPGVKKEKLMIYGGGITEWTSNSLPVETGERNSGQLAPAKP
jgi:rhodanese-related sulfurtransferase